MPEEDLDAPEVTVRLCRIGYLGTPDDWAFAPYDPATDTYQDTVLPDGSFTNTLQDILDCACRLHLAALPPRPIQPRQDFCGAALAPTRP